MERGFDKDLNAFDSEATFWRKTDFYVLLSDKHSRRAFPTRATAIGRARSVTRR